MAELRLSLLLSAATLVVLGLTGQLTFVARECATVPRRLLALILLLVTLGLTVFYPLVTAGEAGEVAYDSIRFVELFAGHIVLTTFLIAWWALSGRPGWERFLVMPRHALRPALRLGLVAGFAGWAFTLAGTAIVASAASLVEHAPAPPTEAPGIVLWLAELPAHRKLFVIAVAMTVEEGFFRAFLQTRIGLWRSSALFAIAHFSYGLPYLVVGVLTISLVLGVVFRRSGHLASCVAAHGIFDAIQLFLVVPAIARFAT